MKCRHCQAELRLPFLDLGHAPPSNAYLTEAALRGPESWFPLRILVCESCWLVQTEDHAGREALFTDDYAYFSSFSSSWLAHSRRYVDAMIGRFGLGKDSMVAEIAANDGYLLQYVKEAGIACYGVEPTASTAQAARDRGIDIVQRFFGVELGDELTEGGRAADLIAANNVLAHVPDINDFVSGFAALLKPQGVATFEFPHLLRMVQEGQFDTVYHEHYSYLSLTAVSRIFTANGLSVFDVEHLGTHGGSLRVFAQRLDTGKHETGAEVARTLDEEQRAGVAGSDFYARFQQQAERVKNDLLAFLVELRRGGKRIAAYGAAAKGNTLLNFAGVRPDLLPYVVDLNPAKQDKYLPGSHIPIVAEARLREDRPEYILILPWNLKTEVSEQLAYARHEWGAKLVTAIPSLSIDSGPHA
ncbi:class I SAM-dependent methyltransferase [Achromobacter sp. Root565]|uniref:class I SAM-dependent methyltransferase n=1 Tax=Achromobacter sp. Root565 TaxID=1736564 RepID=UPI0007013090|nr:class I SAM-dependent methyltransferase [Achromobacter sp. Root565]KQZ98179.1 SAM-dependent methyltransferase [Achromobacter sp. Root565]